MVIAGTPARIRRLEPFRAPPEEQANIAELSTALYVPSTALGTHDTHYDLISPSGVRQRMPQSVVHALARIAEVLARGDALTIVPVGAGVTTQQAADLLNVSQQYLIHLLAAGKIPYDRTGKPRRLKIEDVLTYKKQRDLECDAKLDALAKLTEDFGGYDETKTPR